MLFTDDGVEEEELPSSVGYASYFVPTDAPPSDGGEMPTVPIPSGEEVAVTCTSCSCVGTTQDGDDVMVFENPSSGNRVSSRTVTPRDARNAACAVYSTAHTSSLRVTS